MYLDLTILTISFIPSIVTLTKSYTTISDVWIDNFIFNDNGNNGWKDIGNYCGSQGCTQDDPMKNGSLNTYHGPYHSFQGDGQSTTHYLSQYFYCLYPSNIHISYTIGACNGDFDDHYKFYFNNSEIDTFDGNEPNNNFNDQVLDDVCSAWQYIGRRYNDIAIVDANQLFEPKWEFFVDSNDYFIVYLIEITCDGTPYPTTTQPTFSPISPTDSPTHLPSTTPSISPSNHPSRYPSISPSEIPSNSPSEIPSTLPTISPSNKPSYFPTISPINDNVVIETTSTNGLEKDESDFEKKGNDDQEMYWILFLIIGAMIMFCLLVILMFYIYISLRRRKKKQLCAIERELETVETVKKEQMITCTSTNEESENDESMYDTHTTKGFDGNTANMIMEDDDDNDGEMGTDDEDLYREQNNNVTEGNTKK